MSKSVVIISGGTLDTAFTKSIIEKEACYIIGVDKGVGFLHQHQITPDYIVGDFDSLDPDIVKYYKEETDVPIREFNPVKDASDTEIALRLAMNIGGKEITILGATGNRVDHLWANIQILMIAYRGGAKATILDPFNKIYLIDGETHIKKSEAYGKYFSVFPLGESVLGFTITGAKYPLRDHTLTAYDSLCVSNQIVEDEVVISFPMGIVILMETTDSKVVEP